LSTLKNIYKKASEVSKDNFLENKKKIEALNKIDDNSHKKIDIFVRYLKENFLKIL